jgi:hypothetical protein
VLGLSLGSGVGLVDGSGVAVGTGLGEAVEPATDAAGTTVDGSAATADGRTLGPGVDQPPSGNAEAPPHAATATVSGMSSRRSRRTGRRDRMRDSFGIADDRRLAPGDGSPTIHASPEPWEP